MLSTLSKIKFVKSTTVAQARVLSTFRGSTAALSPDASYTTEAAAEQPYLMTNSEAFVETMVAHGVDTTFGIVGSAFMDSLDLVNFLDFCMFV